MLVHIEKHTSRIRDFAPDYWPFCRQISAATKAPPVGRGVTYADTVQRLQPGSSTRARLDQFRGS